MCDPATASTPGKQACTGRFSRRTLLKATAGIGAVGLFDRLVGAGPRPAAASGTRAVRVSADDMVTAAHTAGERVIVAEFPFDGVGASWPGSSGDGFAVAFSFSDDGAHFTAPIIARPADEFRGRATRDGRVFTQVVFTNRPSQIRYSAVDAAGQPTTLPGLEIVYIDASAGPQSGGIVTSTKVLALKQPAIVSRAGWGADESFRFYSWGGEIFPPEYRTVEHVIVHHTETLNDQDPYVAIRIIYYYHAIELGWGDIGYNYLVGQNGTIFEGRIGGEDVIGHHSYEYAEGSSGITCIGTYETVSITSATHNALTAIVAWVARDLDPLGSRDFHSTPHLPTICGHRDVGYTTCPGDTLYAELPSLRADVARILDDASEPPDGDGSTEFATGDNVVFTGETMLRAEPASGATVLRRVKIGTDAAVQRATRTTDGREWFAVRLIRGDYGYVLGKYLDPAPLGKPSTPVLEVADRVVATINPLPLRRYPGVAQDAPFVTNPASVARVTGGPVAANGQQWYQVLTTLRTEGWVMQSELKLARTRKVSLSLTSGPANKSVTLTLKGFPARSGVDLLVGGNLAATLPTDAYGGWTGQIRIPYVPYGKQKVRAQRGYATALTTYSVMPRLGIGPAAGAGGSAVTAYLTGYPAGQPTLVQAKLDGSWTDTAAGTIDPSGRAKISFIAPAAELGALALRATSESATASASFTVTASPASLTPSATPEPAATVTATPTPEPEATASPTNTPMPTQPPVAAEPTVPPAEPVIEPTPSPAATTTPEPAPEPTATPGTGSDLEEPVTPTPDQTPEAPG